MKELENKKELMEAEEEKVVGGIRGPDYHKPYVDPSDLIEPGDGGVTYTW